MSYMKYNPNPIAIRASDCTIRALAKALNISWEEAYIRACVNGFLMGDMPSTGSVWGSVLRQNGFYRYAIPDYLPENYSAEDFCLDNPIGIYVLDLGGNHVATVVDGILYDSWDSSKEIPQYYWYKKG